MVRSRIKSSPGPEGAPNPTSVAGGRQPDADAPERAVDSLRRRRDPLGPRGTCLRQLERLLAPGRPALRTLRAALRADDHATVLVVERNRCDLVEVRAA